MSFSSSNSNEVLVLRERLRLKAEELLNQTIEKSGSKFYEQSAAIEAKYKILHLEKRVAAKAPGFRKDVTPLISTSGGLRT